MRILLPLLFLLLTSLLISTDLSAQEIPLVYEVENRCEDCPEPLLPSFRDLPRISALPNPFAWSDGRGILKNKSDWKYRRAEIGKEFEHFETGTKPARPDSIEASYEDGTLTVNVTVNGETLTLTSQINLPEGEGPFPLIIGMAGPTGSLPGDIFTSRDIAQMGFNFGQVMAHTQNRGSEPINEIYPEHTNMGAYTAWPWGVSRLIDGLELVSEDLPIDLDHMGVTGCSFAGKMALFSGAFDERIALTISIESGGGGYTSWRANDGLFDRGSVEQLRNTNYSWFRSNFFQFAEDVDKLPFDHHELMAMVAPRALLVTGNHGWEWLADESGYVASAAAQKVWDALGVPDRFGYYNMGGHNHCALTPEKQGHVEAFVDKFLLGDEGADTDVAATPYNTDLSPWIKWETPVLGDGESFMETAPLSQPANEAQNQDTSLTFQWVEVEGAQIYYFQLSTSSGFANIAASDSTTETSITLDSLEKGRNYYWRIQVKNTEGVLGPWSQPAQFTTAIELPVAPVLDAAVPHSRRDDYVNFYWRKTPNVTRYSIELSEDESFVKDVKSASTSDTSTVLFGTEEGLHYYWRVQAENISGIGPWSEVSDFTLIIPPRNLELENNQANEITLRWEDNSDVEDGFIIVRKQGSESSFSVIDTVAENEESYVDASLSADLTSYTYQVQAYMGLASSNYSNEASLTTVSVDEETAIPADYSLHQNYPNPFNPTTNIIFEVPQTTNVQLAVFNMLGQKVKTLIDGRVSAGKHTVVFDAGPISSGMYFYSLWAGDFMQSRKLSLIK